MKRETM